MMRVGIGVVLWMLISFDLTLAQAIVTDSTAQARLANSNHRLRITVQDSSHAGKLDRVTADSIFLTSRGFAFSDISRIQIERRGTSHGLASGAISGAGLAAILAVIFNAVGGAASALPREGDDGFEAQDVANAALFGFAFGGFAGAIIGSQVKTWKTLRNSTSPVLIAEISRPATRSTLELAPGLLFDQNSVEPKTGGRAAWLLVRQELSLGVEFGRYTWNSEASREPSAHEHVTHLGLVARKGFSTSRGIAPYMLAGFGWGGPVFGVGAQASRLPRSLHAEARFHLNGDPYYSPYFTFSLGLLTGRDTHFAQ